MRQERLQEILRKMQEVRILVVGDFFLDQYWSIDARLEEISLETHLEAHQVVEVRLSPGAAGTVTNNLAALEIGATIALGIVGDDGNGFELLRQLRSRGITTEMLIASDERHTPTYTKPMRRYRAGSEKEMPRFDLKNRSPLPSALEEKVIERLWSAATAVDGIVVLDQVQEADCGVITHRVREELMRFATENREKVVLADSRLRIAKYRGVFVKPNLAEGIQAAESPSDSSAEAIIRKLSRQTGRPVFLTLGQGGIASGDENGCRRCPVLPVKDPIDPVGAGDSANAAIAAALCAGASIWEATQLANLAAAVTVRKTGTTGTASAGEILELAARHRDQVERWSSNRTP